MRIFFGQNIIDYLKAQKIDFGSIFDGKRTLEEEAFYLKSQIEDLEKV
jgi:hypothetical protein